MIKRVFCTLVFCLLLFSHVYALEAEDITSSVEFTVCNIEQKPLLDGKVNTYAKGEDVEIAFLSDVPMGGAWIRYSAAPEGGRLNGKNVGENGFFSEYIDFGGEKKAVLSYSSASVCDIRVYSQGTLPDDVQVWEKGEEKADLLLFAAHSDDEQLFFAGLVPYYVAKDKVNVRVCFFTTPYQDISRVQELLAGLWHCGLRSYPDILPLPDDWSESYDEAKEILERHGYEYDGICAMIRERINKYCPKVLVLHDFEGEYNHGMHIFATNSIIDTVESGGEEDFCPEKIYVHLYKQNEILLPIDEPLDYFGGKSAFNVSQEAFRNHKSQHWTWFYDWIYGDDGNRTKASSIRYCTPVKYGLYYTSVGNDTGNDMLENVELYADIFAREEAERLAEESRKSEESRLAAESERAEESRKAEETVQSVAAQTNPVLQDGDNGFSFKTVALVTVVIFAMFFVIAAIVKRGARNGKTK